MAGCAGGAECAVAHLDWPACDEPGAFYRSELNVEQVRHLDSFRARVISMKAAIDEEKAHATKKSGRRRGSEPAVDVVLGLGDSQEDDALCLRWLRAARWNVRRCSDSFVTYIKWQRDFLDGRGVAAVGPEHCERVLRSGSIFFCGCGQAGEPVLYMRVRRLMDTVNLCVEADTEEFIRAVVFLIAIVNPMLRREHVAAGVNDRAVSPLDPKITLVIDLQACSISSIMFDRALFSRLLSFFQCSFPGTMFYTLLLNPPTLLKLSYSIVRKMLDPVTERKIVVSPSADAIDRIISREQLLVSAGGLNAYVFDYDSFLQSFEQLKRKTRAEKKKTKHGSAGEAE